MSSTRQYQKICQWCGRGFLAQKATTNYCSHPCSSRAYKARKREEQQSTVNNETALTIEKKDSSDLDGLAFLTPTQTAKVLGISRATVYRYLNSGELKSVQFKGKTLIRRADIDQMFDNATEYRARPRECNSIITDFYTIKELEMIYSVGESWAHKLIKDNNIPKVLKRGKTHVSKKHIDSYFAGRAADPTITEWYTSDEIAQKYNMSTKTIYGFVYDNKIPKKKEGRNTLYSKEHFDRARNKEKQPEPEYYTMQEAMEKFDITRDVLYHHIKRNNIAKIKVGKYSKVNKAELDKSFEIYIIK